MHPTVHCKTLRYRYILYTVKHWEIDSINRYLYIHCKTLGYRLYKYIYTVKHGDIVSINIYQCCGVKAGGAEIIWGPRAGARAENKFK